MGDSCLNSGLFLCAKKRRRSIREAALLLILSFHRLILQAVSAGARLAIEECQHQFRSARWNCSVSPENPENVFGGVMLVSKYIHTLSFSFSGSFNGFNATDVRASNALRH